MIVVKAYIINNNNDNTSSDYAYCITLTKIILYLL